MVDISTTHNKPDSGSDRVQSRISNEPVKEITNSFEPTSRQTDQRVESLTLAELSDFHDALEKLTSFIMFVSDRGLSISIDQELSKIVLTVIDTETEEVVRQIPSEEVLDIMKKIRQLSDDYFGNAKGILIEKEI